MRSKLLALILFVFYSTGALAQALDARDLDSEDHEYCRLNAQGQYVLPPAGSSVQFESLQGQLHNLHLQMQQALRQSLEGRAPQLGGLWAGLKQKQQSLQKLTQQMSQSSLELRALLQSYFELVSHYEWLAGIHKSFSAGPALQHSIQGLQLDFSAAVFSKLFSSSAHLPPNAEVRKQGPAYVLQLAPALSYLNLQHALAKNQHWPLEKRYLESVKCRMQILALKHYASNLLFAEQPIEKLFEISGADTHLCHQLNLKSWAQILGLQASPAQQRKAQIIQQLPSLESIDPAADAQTLQAETLQANSSLNPQHLETLLTLFYPQAQIKLKLIEVQSENEVFMSFYELSDRIDPLEPHIMALKQFMTQKLKQAYQQLPLFQLGAQIVQLPEVQQSIFNLSRGCGYSLASQQELLASMSDTLFVASLQAQALNSPLEFNSPQDVQQFLIEVRTQSLAQAFEYLMYNNLGYRQQFTTAQALSHFNAATYSKIKNYVTQKVASSNFAQQLFASLQATRKNFTQDDAAHDFTAQKNRNKLKSASQKTKKNRKLAQQQVPLYIQGVHKAALEVKNIETIEAALLPFHFQSMQATMQPELTGLQALNLKNINTLIYVLHPQGTHHSYWATHFKPYIDEQNKKTEADCQLGSSTSNLYNTVKGWFSSASSEKGLVNEQCIKVHRVVMALQLHQQKAPQTLAPVLKDLEAYYKAEDVEALIQQYRQNYVQQYYQEFPLLKQYTSAPSHTWAFKKAPANLYDALKNKSSVDKEVIDLTKKALQLSSQSAQKMFHDALTATKIKDLDNYVIHTRLIENILGQPALEGLLQRGSAQAWTLSTPSDAQRYNTYFQQLIEPELLHHHAQQKDKKINLMHATAQARDEFKVSILYMWMGFAGVPWLVGKMRLPWLSSLATYIKQRNQWMTNAYSQLVTALYALNLVDQQVRIQSYSKKRTLINEKFSMPSFNSEDLRQAYLSSSLSFTQPALSVDDHRLQSLNLSNRIGSFSLNIFAADGGARSQQLIDALIVAWWPAYRFSEQSYKWLRHNKPPTQATIPSAASTLSTSTQNLKPQQLQKIERKMFKKIDRFKIEHKRSFSNLNIDPTDPMAFNLTQLQNQQSQLLMQYASRPLKQDVVNESYKNIVMFVSRLTKETPTALRSQLSRKLLGSERWGELQRYFNEAERLFKYRGEL